MPTMRGLHEELPNLPQLDEEATDRADRMLLRRKALIDTAAERAEFRETIQDEYAKRRLDALPGLMGPKPETAQEWADRALIGLEIAMVEGTGLNAKAAASYAAECNKRAAWLEPTKFGDLKMLQVDARVQTRVIDSSALTPEERQAMRGILQRALAAPAPEPDDDLEGEWEEVPNGDS